MKQKYVRRKKIMKTIRCYGYAVMDMAITVTIINGVTVVISPK